MKALPFTITLLEPTLVIMLGSGDANQLESFSYIPGSVLRNALAARYIGQSNLGDKAAQDPTCRSLFFEGRVRFLNAYPIDRQGQRTLPTPLSWQANKEDLAEFNEKENGRLAIKDFSHEPETDLEAGKPVGKDFCALADGEVEFFQVKRRVMMHNARTTRRVIADNTSTMFQYEAVAEGEKFAGVILADDTIDLSLLHPLFTAAPLSLGKSRSAGYGRIEVTLGQMQTAWHEYRPAEDYELPGNDPYVVITLLSDALVRDRNGSYSADLSYALDLSPNALQRDRSTIKTQIVGGFNRKWGLHLPQATAVKMGSVFVYQAADLDAAKLAHWQLNGLGERTLEGFGRIAVNWQRSAHLKVIKIRRSPSPSPVSTLTADSPAGQLAQRISTHQLRQKLDQKLLARITALKIQDAPSKSQLSRVRLVARRAMEQGQLQPIIGFLNGIRNKPAYKELNDSRLEQQSLYHWLTEYAQDPAKIEQVLSGSGGSELGGIKAEFDVAMQIEYTARLIEGVVKRELDRQRKEKR